MYLRFRDLLKDDDKHSGRGKKKGETEIHGRKINGGK